MDKFFSQANHAGSLTSNINWREMWLEVKADLLGSLESDLFEDNVNNHVPVRDATILNGAAVVQMLNPKASRTFQGYGESLFAPYIHIQLDKCNRVDIVWDVYRPANLKASSRKERGKGSRRGWLFTVMPKNQSDSCQGEKK